MLLQEKGNTQLDEDVDSAVKEVKKYLKDRQVCVCVLAVCIQISCYRDSSASA